MVPKSQFCKLQVIYLFIIYTLYDPKSSESCLNNSQLIKENPISADEKKKLLEGLLSPNNLQVQVKPDSIDWQSLADSTFQCPIKVSPIRNMGETQKH